VKVTAPHYYNSYLPADSEWLIRIVPFTSIVQTKVEVHVEQVVGHQWNRANRQNQSEMQHEGSETRGEVSGERYSRSEENEASPDMLASSCLRGGFPGGNKSGFLRQELVREHRKIWGPNGQNGQRGFLEGV
jgi:tRNA 2-selenouridine synthase SelU